MYNNVCVYDERSNVCVCVMYTLRLGMYDERSVGTPHSVSNNYTLRLGMYDERSDAGTSHSVCIITTR